MQYHRRQQLGPQSMCLESHTRPQSPTTHTSPQWEEPLRATPTFGMIGTGRSWKNVGGNEEYSNTLEWPTDSDQLFIDKAGDFVTIPWMFQKHWLLPRGNVQIPS